MVWIRCCPRCKGDLQDNQDIYGNYFVCIQCGYYLTDSEETRLRRPARFRSSAGATAAYKGIKPLTERTPEEVKK
jgi:hypothetical protein